MKELLAIFQIYYSCSAARPALPQAHQKLVGRLSSGPSFEISKGRPAGRINPMCFRVKPTMDSVLILLYLIYRNNKYILHYVIHESKVP